MLALFPGSKRIETKCRCMLAVFLPRVHSNTWSYQGSARNLLPNVNIGRYEPPSLHTAIEMLSGKPG